VLKGTDGGDHQFVFRSFHAGKHGDEVVIVDGHGGPVWYSSRLVVDEWKRGRRGVGTRFTSENQPTKVSPDPSPLASPTRTIGERQGDGPTSTSPSSSSQEEESKKKEAVHNFVMGKKNGVGEKQGGQETEKVTITDQRLVRFMQKLQKEIPDPGWIILHVAMQPGADRHQECLALCMAAAERLGKGWPRNWPTDDSMFDRLVMGKGAA
jgi:hypothetical protein